MPKFCSSSNPAKPVLARLSAIHSLKNYPYFHAEIEDLYVGDGRSFLDGTPAGKEIEKFIYEKELNAYCLPFDNIFFIAPREFEWFLFLVKEHKLRLAEIIRRVVEEEKRDKKLQFSQHLRSIFPNTLGSPSFVTELCDALFSRFEQKLSVK